MAYVQDYFLAGGTVPAAFSLYVMLSVYWPQLHNYRGIREWYQSSHLRKGISIFPKMLNYSFKELLVMRVNQLQMNEKACLH